MDENETGEQMKDTISFYSDFESNDEDHER